MANRKDAICFTTWLRNVPVGQTIEGSILSKLKKMPDLAEIVLLGIAHGECAGAPKNIQNAARRLIVKFRQAGGSPRTFNKIDKSCMKYMPYHSL